MMSKPLLIAILIIFCVHFIIFLRLSMLRRKIHHFLATISFFLLIMFSSIRLWAPKFMLLGHPAHIYFRISAWFTSAMTLTIYIWNRGKSVRQ